MGSPTMCMVCPALHTIKQIIEFLYNLLGMM